MIRPFLFVYGNLAILTTLHLWDTLFTYFVHHIFPKLMNFVRSLEFITFFYSSSSLVVLCIVIDEIFCDRVKDLEENSKKIRALRRNVILRSFSVTKSHLFMCLDKDFLPHTSLPYHQNNVMHIFLCWPSDTRFFALYFSNSTFSCDKSFMLLDQIMEGKLYSLFDRPDFEEKCDQFTSCLHFVVWKWL